jgi:hypothetical protein
MEMRNFAARRPAMIFSFLLANPGLISGSSPGSPLLWDKFPPSRIQSILIRQIFLSPSKGSPGKGAISRETKRYSFSPDLGTDFGDHFSLDAEIFNRGGAMAVSGKYGKVFISKIGEEEPIFILRAQDQLAAQTIEMYRDLAAKNGLPLAESLQKEIEAFRNWGGLKRMPD